MLSSTSILNAPNITNTEKVEINAAITKVMKKRAQTKFFKHIRLAVKAWLDVWEPQDEDEEDEVAESQKSGENCD